MPVEGGEREKGDCVRGRSSPFLSLWCIFPSYTLPSISASFSATENND